MKGLEEGATQLSTKYDELVVWNFPVEATFKSTNPFGCALILVGEGAKGKQAMVEKKPRGPGAGGESDGSRRRKRDVGKGRMTGPNRIVQKGRQGSQFFFH